MFEREKLIIWILRVLKFRDHNGILFIRCTVVVTASAQYLLGTCAPIIKVRAVSRLCVFSFP